MEAATQKLQRWKWDPFLPIDWRAQDAHRLLAGETTRWADTDDRDVQEYLAYLRSLAAGACQATTPPASRRAVISAAAQLAKQHEPVRWLVEAAILAAESDAQIAERCGLDPDVVATFAHLFLAVRQSLKAEGWILTQVIGRSVWRGCRDDELDRLWQAFAYFGGPLILNTLAQHFFASWQIGEPATIAVYFTTKSTAPLELKAAIAAHAIPVNAATGLAFMQIHEELMTIEKTMSSAAAKDKLRQATIRLWRSGPAALRRSVLPQSSTEIATSSREGKAVAAKHVENGRGAAEKQGGN